MIRIITLLILGFWIAESAAQEKRELPRREKRTLMQNHRLTGGFLGLGFKSSTIGNQSAFWVGGEVGSVFENKLGIGIAGYGLVNSVRTNEGLESEKPAYYQAGYGGLLLERITLENRIISLSFPILLGVGGITETEVGGVIDELENFDLDEDDFLKGNAFWVLEPGAQLNLNVTRWMKINAGVGYRAAYGMDKSGITPDLINGIQGTFTLKLGWF